MGMELQINEATVMEVVHDGDEGYLSDSDAFSSVVDVLNAVMVRVNLILPLFLVLL